MATFNSHIPRVLGEIEMRLNRALERNGNRGKRVAAPLTPVDTRFAQKSVHAIVIAGGRHVGGDTADRNGNPVPPYPARSIPTVFVGSNTEPRIDNFTGPGGYYLGLEMGVFSRQGSHMLASALTEMITTIPDDLRAEMR